MARGKQTTAAAAKRAAVAAIKALPSSTDANLSPPISPPEQEEVASISPMENSVDVFYAAERGRNGKLEKRSSSAAAVVFSPSVNVDNLRDLAYLSNSTFTKRFEVATSNHWLHYEIDLKPDKANWATLKPAGMKHTLTEVFKYFAVVDQLVLDGLTDHVVPAISSSPFLLPHEKRDIKGTLLYQAFIEDMHGKFYTLLLSIPFPDHHEAGDQLVAMATQPHMRPMMVWAHEHLDPKKGLLHNLLTLACVELISIGNKFAAIFFLQDQGDPLTGTTDGNNYVRKDENEHAANYFDILSTIWRRMIAKKLDTGVTRESVKGLLDSCLECEDLFIEGAMGADDIPGFTMRDWKIFARCMANYISVSVGMGYMYPEAVENPFPFMSSDMPTKVNYFERHSENYDLSKAQVREWTIGGDGKGGLLHKTMSSISSTDSQSSLSEEASAVPVIAAVNTRPANLKRPAPPPRDQVVKKLKESTSESLEAVVMQGPLCTRGNGGPDCTACSS